MHGRAGWSLSLVIPAYNEDAGIAQAVAEADDTLSQIAGEYEILIVDDGSPDRTFDVASDAARSRSHVRVLRHETNSGYGAALRTGFEAARFERVAFTDADCQFDLNDLAKLVPLAEKAPVVAGYRIDPNDPWRRRILPPRSKLRAPTLLGALTRHRAVALAALLPA